jgi:hypothetical protein
MGWEVRAMTLGGITSLNKLMLQDDDGLLNRPRLNKLLMLKILLISYSKTLYLNSAKSN